MYLGSPRMAEMVIGEKTTLEEMGGAKMHCSVSGCGDVLCKTEQEALEGARAYLSYLPSSCGAPLPVRAGLPPAKPPAELEAAIPADENKPFDIFEVIDRVIDAGSFFELKKLFAREVVTGFARLDGQPLGIIANQPKWKGGVLFVDSADKAARFIQMCDAFGVPLLYLADVPGFMIGKAVERQGIIRAGAKMISAVSEATVPRVSVIVRKAYGAGLYAMCGPGFAPDACLALPGAQIAVMGPDAAVNAVFYNRIQATPEAERPTLVAKLRDEYRADIELLLLGSELVIDDIVPPAELRAELVRRFAYYRARPEDALPAKKRGIRPV
jgi:acetyl-CoA carboxylase carboxyltransferase component